MKIISSSMTYYYKRVFPALWLGFIVFFTGMMGWIAVTTGRPKDAAPGFLVAAAMLATGYFVFRKLLSGLADEVLDAGDALVVRRDGREERVPLASVKNVSYQPFINPPRITLALRGPSQFGDEISFLPKVRFGEVFYARNPTVQDLVDRVDSARR